MPTPFEFAPEAIASRGDAGTAPAHHPLDDRAVLREALGEDGSHEHTAAPSEALRLSQTVPLPAYLADTYWWAYLHPAGVRVFERQWLVNLILWGNFARLRDSALQEIGGRIDGRVLQIACVYGNFTEHMAQRLGPVGRIDVVDVAPVQLRNLSAKLRGDPRVSLHHQDSTDLAFADESYDHVVVFFLLHEQPERARARTVAQALRVVRPGGKVIFVDYHRPAPANPFRYVMVPILKTLEPFAMDLWRKEVTDWLPADVRPSSVEKETYFGGLYQKVVITV
ncbi:MAG TPA: rhodoquinone biosynthesis methyltransferase RquA [Burkholderiales bacterium]|nr:rhodoquinone biosynthesis methyltransferase RquA [Burkholderiales bacterium]